MFYPISTGQRAGNVDFVENLKDKLLKILTSGQSVNLMECTFRVHVVNMPRGAGGRGKKILNLAKDRYTKQCIVRIDNAGTIRKIRLFLQTAAILYSSSYCMVPVPVAQAL